MDALKFQLAEAKDIGVVKQIEIARLKLSTAERLRKIKEIGCLEVITKNVSSYRIFTGVGVTKKPHYIKGLKYIFKYAFCCEDDSENYYSIFSVDSFPATIPCGILRSYDKLKHNNLFDDFTIWYRAKDRYDAAAGAGLLGPVEKDPYLIGRIRATDGKEVDRWFVIDSWEEKESIP
jgi:hypothetical protein